MPDKTTPDDEFDEAIEQTIEATLAAVKKREAQPYDGVVGELYESWPSHHHTEFESARAWILTKVSHADAVRYLHDYGKMFEPGYNGLPIVPVGYQAVIGTLHYYFTAMQLGEIEGLRMVAGDNAVIGLRSRRGPTERRAARDKPEIQRIGRQHWVANPKATAKDILVSKELSPYVRQDDETDAVEQDSGQSEPYMKRYAPRTILTWLREVDPRPITEKRGPRIRNK